MSYPCFAKIYRDERYGQILVKIGMIEERGDMYMSVSVQWRDPDGDGPIFQHSIFSVGLDPLGYDESDEAYCLDYFNSLTQESVVKEIEHDFLYKFWTAHQKVH